MTLWIDGLQCIILKRKKYSALCLLFFHIFVTIIHDKCLFVSIISIVAVEVNYMDDVGQTLLNWASAFGTQEMVEFLCERGADVNRGQRSSSLHYAACFGRPQVAKVRNDHVRIRFDYLCMVVL